MYEVVETWTSGTMKRMNAYKSIAATANKLDLAESIANELNAAWHGRMVEHYPPSSIDPVYRAKRPGYEEYTCYYWVQLAEGSYPNNNDKPDFYYNLAMASYNDWVDRIIASGMFGRLHPYAKVLF